MDVLQAITSRRSVRKFTGELINDEQLNAVLNAGFSAPSAHNFQPWHFIVFKNKTTLEAIANTHPYAKMLPQAGCGILVCGEMTKQEKEGFVVQDCSAAIQNMLLAAHGMGLGAVWCGIYPYPELMNLVSGALQVPDSILPIGLIVVGNKAEDRPAANRFDASKVHNEQW